MSKLLDLVDRYLSTEPPSEEGEIPRLLQAQKVAKRTKDLFATRGWCLWECATGPARIVIIRDTQVTGYPTGYPTYIEAELALLSTAGDRTRRLVDEAKKMTEAVVISNFVPSPFPFACIEGPGVCGLRTDESQPFTCAETWATCQFIR